jgi:hypothetical protein
VRKIAGIIAFAIVCSACTKTGSAMTVEPESALYITGASKILKGKVPNGNGGTEVGQIKACPVTRISQVFSSSSCDTTSASELD